MDYSHHKAMLGALRLECIFIVMKICDDILRHNSYIIIIIISQKEVSMAKASNPMPSVVNPPTRSQLTSDPRERGMVQCT